MNRVDKSPFGKIASGVPCSLYTLENNNSTKVQISDFGAAMVSFYCRDKKGKLGNILLRHKDASVYESAGAYLGALVGPYANRIGGAQFSLDRKKYKLTPNQSGNTLHGAEASFAHRQWRCELCEVQNSVPTLVLLLDGVDGCAGFPGNTNIRVQFQLLEDDCLRVHMLVTADKKTPISLTQHPYFNLAGEGNSASETLYHHEFNIHSQTLLEVDNNLVPTGKLKDIAGTVFDFSEMKTAMDLLAPLDKALLISGGFDHNYCFEPWSSETPTMRLQATARDTQNGRMLEVYSSLPGLQFYTGNHLPETHFERFEGFCFEPQYYPDSPNKPAFPFQWTEPGKPFSHTIEWRVSAS